jgi:cytochrome c oxidase subunit 2
MLFLRKIAFWVSFPLVWLSLSAVASADQPTDGGIWFQPSASPTMERIAEFHDTYLFPVITGIVILVFALMLYVFIRFNHKANPVPSKTTHNSLVEVIWTAVPALILFVIAFPSMDLLYYADRSEDTEMTIKAIGKQWYWSYEYPDNGDFTFDALMKFDDELEEGEPRLLATDYPVVVPVNTKVKLLITADDVLHSFAVPALGLKLDGVPGRINETWVEVTKEGTYYGQCSEICGTGHSYMPIMIKAVSKEEFDNWVVEAQEEFAKIDRPDDNLRLAQAPAKQ